MVNKLTIIDFETGGKDPIENPITQYAIQLVDPTDFTLLYSYENFVKPYNDLTIEKKALEYTRMTMQQINNGVDYKQLIKDFIDCAKIANKSGKAQSKPIFVGHNIEFDIGFIEAAFYFANKNIYDYYNRTPIDTIQYMYLFEGGSLKKNENSRYTLTSCCERFGIKLKNAHGAPADVDATKQLIKALIQKLRNNDTSSSSNGITERSKSKRVKHFFEF